MYNQPIVSATTKKVLEAALKLAPEARAAVAEELFESLQGSGCGKLSPAWEAEIGRRIKDLDAGRVETIPAEQVFAEIDEDLRRIRTERTAQLARSARSKSSRRAQGGDRLVRTTGAGPRRRTSKSRR